LLARADGVLEEAVAAEERQKEQIRRLERVAMSVYGEDWERKTYITDGDEENGRAPPG